MKKKDKSDWRQKSKKELAASIEAIQSELVKIKFDQASGKIMNNQLKKNKNRTLAFLKTILVEKEFDETV